MSIKIEANNEEDWVTSQTISGKADSGEETDGYEKEEKSSKSTLEESAFSFGNKDTRSSAFFDWFSYLVLTDSEGAHFTKFPHVIGSDALCLNEGSLVCVPSTSGALWVGVVLRLWGLQCLVRFVGMGDDHSQDMWLNLAVDQVLHMYAAEELNMNLHPPPVVEEKQLDLRRLLEQVMDTNTGMLPPAQQALSRIRSRCRFSVGQQLEYLDYTASPCTVRVASVKRCVGRRLLLSMNIAKRTETRWCSEGSPLLRPVGWAESVKHRIIATFEYRSHVKEIVNKHETAVKSDLFASTSPVPEGSSVKQGMKLEIIDPAQPARVFAACVKRVLGDNFLMVGAEYIQPEEDRAADWFSLHISSPYCLPVGFASDHHLPLVIPLGYTGDLFEWNSYMASTNSEEVPRHLLNRDYSANRFLVDSKLEAVDLVDPKLVCVATVVRVVAHLLLIHFDGWGEEYDQWVPFDSCDIFPVGWCQAVGYPLTPPPNIESQWNILHRKPKLKKKKKKAHRKHGTIVLDADSEESGSETKSHSSTGKVAVQQPKENIKMESESESSCKYEVLDKGMAVDSEQHSTSIAAASMSGTPETEQHSTSIAPVSMSGTPENVCEGTALRHCFTINEQRDVGAWHKDLCSSPTTVDSVDDAEASSPLTPSLRIVEEGSDAEENITERTRDLSYSTLLRNTEALQEVSSNNKLLNKETFNFSSDMESDPPSD